MQIKTVRADQGLVIAKGFLNLMALNDLMVTLVDLREGFRSERASERRDQELSLCWTEKSQE